MSGLTDVGVRILEPKFTSAPLTNPLPEIVRETRSPLPANAIGGESLLIETGQLQGAAVTVSDTPLLTALCAEAVICTVPAVTPVASPFVSTIATEESLEAHVNVMPLIASPC